MGKFNIFKKGICMFCGILAAGTICMQTGFVSFAYPESGVINDTGVNIRSSADTTSTDNVMKRAEENMTVSVVGEETGTDGKTWLKVTFTDGGTEKTGFVREDFVTLSETEEPGPGVEETEDPQIPATDKNPDGLVPVEGLDEGLTCYFNIDGSHYYINQGFTDEMIPDGFTRVEMDYRGENIQVVQANEIDFYLAYLTNYDDQDQSDWCMYDAQAQAFSYWIKLETMQGKYLYLLDTFGAGEMDFGYEKKELEIDGKLVEAWQLMLEEEEDLTGENDCFYYVYGINQDGNKGLYSYYTKDGTYQRNVLTGLEIVDDEYLSNEENTQLLETQLKELRDKYSDDMSKRLTIICILIVVCVLLLFVAIHLALKSRRAEEDEYEDDEEEDYEEERPRFRKRGEPAAGPDEETKSRLEKLISDELEEPAYDGQLPEIAEISLDDMGEKQQSDSDTTVPEPDMVLGEVSEELEDCGIEDAYADDDYENDEEADYEEEDDEEYVKPKRRGLFFGRRRKEDYEDDEDDDYEEDEEADYEEEDEEEYVKPKRRGLFFGRRSKDDYEDDDYEEDEEEDDYEDEEEEDYEEEADYEEEDDEEYVKPKRRGFFFSRRRVDDYEEDYEDEDDEEEDEEDRMSWAQSQRAAKEAKSREKEEAKAQRDRARAEANERKSARRSRYEDEDEEEDLLVRKANKKSKAADYAERTVTAKKSSRIPMQTFEDDDDFEFEFIDLDDDF